MSRITAAKRGKEADRLGSEKTDGPEEIGLDVPHGTPGRSYFIVKRCFDVVFSLLGLLVLSPILLLIAVTIRLEDGGPVIYRRRCVGAKGGYDMLRFRCMEITGELFERFGQRV